MSRPQRRAALHHLLDQELMQLAGDGDASAYEALFDRHVGAAFSLAYRMCRRRSIAEDVVQDVFLTVWRSGGRYEHSRGSVRSWLLTMVHNRTIDALRRASVTGRHCTDGDDVIEQ